MSEPVKNILDWQNRLRERPAVWVVETYDSYDGWQHTGSVYETRDAAQVEVDWWKRGGNTTAKIACLGHLHSEQLSRERWEP